MFNKLKDMIWEEDKNAPSQPRAAAPVQVQAQSGSGFPPAAPNKYVQALQTAVKGRSTAYTALLQNAERLADVVPDPNMRLKAAFKMIAGEGRGLREVLEAIKVHDTDLEAQRMQFQQAMEREQKATIGGMEAEKAQAEQSRERAQGEIVQLNQRIQALNEQIVQDQNKAVDLGNRITGEKSRFTIAGQEFEHALSIVRGELEGQKSIIQSSLS